MHSNSNLKSYWNFKVLTSNFSIMKFSSGTTTEPKKTTMLIKKKDRDDAHAFFCLSMKFDSAKVRRKTTKSDAFVTRQASITWPFILEFFFYFLTLAQISLYRFQWNTFSIFSCTAVVLLKRVIS